MSPSRESIMLRACSLFLCLCFALATPATAFADATARVLSVTPGVRYSLGNTGEALAVKMDVPVKAVVVSDATGKAQLIFPDDSTLSIAPDTQISLAEYVDAEREENIVLDLVSGMARIITGESNRKNPQAFTVNTPQASIGIRGTLVTIQAGGDVTRVYLSETSGLGVSVRNLGTGQVMELRKPGTIINVGANFMEERKAQKEEAASFSAALRGKSRAEIERATARAYTERLKNAPIALATEGMLPRAGLADPIQTAALNRADALAQAILVENHLSAVTISLEPDISIPTEIVPITPAPILPEQPVDNIFKDGFDSLLPIYFNTSVNKLNPIFDYYVNGEKDNTDIGDIIISFTSKDTQIKDDSYLGKAVMNLPHYFWNTTKHVYTHGPIYISAATYTVKLNGEFKVSGNGCFVKGEFISPTLIRIQSAEFNGHHVGPNNSIYFLKSILTSHIEIHKSK